MEDARAPLDGGDEGQESEYVCILEEGLGLARLR